MDRTAEFRQKFTELVDYFTGDDDWDTDEVLDNVRGNDEVMITGFTHLEYRRYLPRAFVQMADAEIISNDITNGDIKNLEFAAECAAQEALECCLQSEIEKRGK